MVYDFLFWKRIYDYMINYNKMVFSVYVKIIK